MLVGRVAAAGEPARADALLRELADVPVLAVDGVPELDGLGGVEALRGHRGRLEEPLADDLGAPGPARPQRVHHRVVGVERDQRVGQQRVVEDLALARARDRRPAAAAAHRRDALVERHRAAAPRARALVVDAAEVVREPVELRVHAGAVQALGVVLDDRLPVGGDVVADAGGPAQRAEPVAGEPLRQRADVLPERRRLARDVDEHEPVQDRAADRGQAEAARLEALDLPGVRGVAQRAVEAVGPRVVGALQAPHAALGLVEQAGAAVAADVVERARRAVLARDHQHALAAELARRGTRRARRARPRGPRTPSRRGTGARAPIRRPPRR